MVDAEIHFDEDDEDDEDQTNYLGIDGIVYRLPSEWSDLYDMSEEVWRNAQTEDGADVRWEELRRIDDLYYVSADYLLEDSVVAVILGRFSNSLDAVRQAADVLEFTKCGRRSTRPRSTLRRLGRLYTIETNWDPVNAVERTVAPRRVRAPRKPWYDTERFEKFSLRMWGPGSASHIIRSPSMPACNIVKHPVDGWDIECSQCGNLANAPSKRAANLVRISHLVDHEYPVERIFAEDPEGAVDTLMVKRIWEYGDRHSVGDSIAAMVVSSCGLPIEPIWLQSELLQRNVRYLWNGEALLLEPKRSVEAWLPPIGMVERDETWEEVVARQEAFRREHEEIRS